MEEEKKRAGGAPKKRAEFKRTRAVYFRTTQEAFELLQKVADEDGSTVSSYVARIVAKAIGASCKIWYYK